MPARTHISVLLDRSGSMEAIRDDARGSYNAYLADQQRETTDKATCSLTLFGGNDVELRHQAVPIAEVPRMAVGDYVPSGATPLYDAMGQAIVSLEKRVESTDRVLFVVITDGHENASSEWSYAAVRAKVAHLMEQGNWTVVYLASTPDAVEIGRGLGILASNAVRLQPGGEAGAMRRLSEATSAFRRSATRSSPDFGSSLSTGDDETDAP